MRNERKINVKTFSQDSGHSSLSYGRNAEKLSTQIYKDLYGDAMMVSIWMGRNMAAGKQQKHLSPGVISLEELKKHQNTTFS